MRLDFPVDRAKTEPRSKSGGGRIGGLAEASGVARLDLVAQRRTLAIADGRVAVPKGLAAVFDRFDGDTGKARRLDLAADPRLVVIAMRRSRQEARCVAGEKRGDSLRHNCGELVLLDAVPDAEHEAAAGPQHPPGLAIRGDLVGKEHRTELTDHDIEGL